MIPVVVGVLVAFVIVGVGLVAIFRSRPDDIERILPFTDPPEIPPGLTGDDRRPHTWGSE